jgi:aminoglycoside phosphotransferase (APT) family kinase protein
MRGGHRAAPPAATVAAGAAAAGAFERVSRLGGPPRGNADLDSLTAPAMQDRLVAALRDGWRADVQVGRVWRAEGGFSNETWFVDVITGDGADTVVLRREALVGPLEPYDLGREAALVEALHASDVPVPAIRMFCPDLDVIGSPFMVMERVEGPVPDYRSLPEYEPWQAAENRSEMARELIRVLEAIQRVDVENAPLAELLASPSGDQPPVVGRIQWILEKLEYQVGSGAVLPVLREAAGWLRANAPALAGRAVLVHGDYKVGNFIWSGNSVVAILDWELAGIGDPLEDVGYACHPLMRMRAPDLMAMLVPIGELEQIYEARFGFELDRRRLHYYVIYALYFHLYTLVSGVVAAAHGADLRAALGYTKFPQATAELIRHIHAFERGAHVL